MCETENKTSDDKKADAEIKQALAWTENQRTSLAANLLRECDLLLGLAIKLDQIPNQDELDTLDIMRGLAVRVRQLNEVVNMAITDSVSIDEMKELAYGC